MKKPFTKPLFSKGQHVRFNGQVGVVIEPICDKRMTYIEQVGTVHVPVILVQLDNGEYRRVTQTIARLA
jgi:hypothetical protein